jgi:hypothetical protein
MKVLQPEVVLALVKVLRCGRFNLNKLMFMVS